MQKNRKILEEHFHLKLDKDDIVHHIDLDGKNNDISNLWLTDKKTHRLIHSQAYNLMSALLRYHMAKGEIIFENGRYKTRLRLKKYIK